MSIHTDKLEKDLMDIHMKMILSPDEDVQDELRVLYREKIVLLKKQKEWEEAMNDINGR